MVTGGREKRLSGGGWARVGEGLQRCFRFVWAVFEGKAAHEFLVAAEVTRVTEPTGKFSTHVSIRDPLPLTSGTAVDRITEACRSQWKTLRQHGHLGGAVQGYCFDRKGLSAIRRRIFQYHSLLK